MNTTTRMGHDTVTAHLSREERNMMIQLANGLRSTYGRAEMVVARRLARKGLVIIKREVFSDRSTLTSVRRTDWQALCKAIEEG